ncbi:MAG: D-2-hydroxyacid dehydrogenase [Oscillibacter sp.]|nr:D-2-hydroxyacid dehydrogenase [Oscillibacter sp.]
MSRILCVVQDFLAEEHREKIRQAADRAGFTPYFFTSDQLDAAKECLQSCEVLYANKADVLRGTSASLRWCAAASAGADAYCADPSLFANPDCILTVSNVYGATISEHVIMVTLELLRQMTYFREPLRRHEWLMSPPIRSIKDGDFTILGTGNLGRTIAARLRSMEARRILGVSHSGRKVDLFDEVLPVSQLDTVLPKTTFLIMALPGTPETVNILNRERITLLPPEAYVVNVGRGNAVDQDALMDALNGDKIAGAALDVAVPEPVPADHPLWDTKNLILTPHISGNMALGYTRDENVRLFCKNLLRYADGETPSGVVDRARGY